MKVTYSILIILGGITMLTGCLKSDLNDLPAFEDAQIVSLFTEFRYQDGVSKNSDGSNKVFNLNLPVTRTFKLKENTGAVSDSVLLTVSVPAASGTFTEQIRSQVTSANLVVYGNLSTAASIAPLMGAPVWGVPGDFSAPRQYLVTAADKKTTRTWVIKIASLVK